MAVPQIVVDAIDKTINALNKKSFEPDPIAGAHFSKITSVMSSAYKRHGLIIEQSVLQSVLANPDFDAWEDKAFPVSAAADSVASNFMAAPEQAVSSGLAFEATGSRTLQIDLVAYNKATKHLSIYEIKRGSGLHDAGKKRQILRDVICMELLAKSYGEARGYEVTSSRAHVIFSYGKCSIKAPYALTGEDLNEHFGYNLKGDVEAANELFKKRLFEILAG